MGSAIPQGGAFVDAQESRIQVAKYSDMGIADMKGHRFADARNRVFRLGNVDIWVVPSFYLVDLLMFRNCVLKLKNVLI